MERRGSIDKRRIGRGGESEIGKRREKLRINGGAGSRGVERKGRGWEENKGKRKHN